MLERITIKEQTGAYDIIIQNEMAEEQAKRIIYANLLWSTLMFLIAMII